jgi:hypothetical protein
LSAYYQGVGLLDEHPSFAVVAFVAAIEEIGKLVIESEKPELCPTCKRPKLSSRTLFRKTLELVRSPERATELADNLYPWRSATAHSGHLFGYETAFGDQPIHLAMPSTVADIFQGAARVRAQDAAKDLLHLVLTGALQLRGASKRGP